MAQSQFDTVAERLNLDTGIAESLRTPMREFRFQVPVRMDDGSLRVLFGYRVQHNDARAPAKGGIRFHPAETLDTIHALAMWMTWKCAVADIPLEGGKVVSVSSWDRQDRTAYTFYNPAGLDPAYLQTITDVYGSIDKQAALQAGCTIEAGDRWLAYDVDVLIPAALEAQITADNVGQISERVKVVAEAANGPTTIEADHALSQRDIFVIPDFLCNAGGVTVSYFESVQNDMNYYWSSEEVLSRLDTKMTGAFLSVLEVAKQQDVRMRDAAYMVAIDRVVRATQLRGCA